eukprot:Skav223569  [mRNA]  locus=scaffold34:455413:455988:- [translate_table: standard]
MLQLCEKGAVGLTLAGPPCETWTSARHLQHEGGPRPLRSRSRPWGLKHLELAEIRQLRTGASLMWRGLRLELAALLRGGAGVTERPALPRDESHASIWATAVTLNYMMKMPSARMFTFEQWRYGSSAIKPTVLRSAGLPAFHAKFLAHGENPTTSRPTTHLGGYDWLKRQFRTASAKEYPSLMCTAVWMLR